MSKHAPPKPLPCPFCGKIYRGDCISSVNGRFECPSCGALGPFPYPPKLKTTLKGRDRRAIEAWNRRLP